MPRVRKGKDIKFNDGPQTFSRHYVEPKDGITQTFHLHLEEYAPGGKSQKHGHVNEAAFYILDGEGYEIHDGVRYDWKAGDVAIVHNNCVHQHFNASPDKPARALVHEDQADVHVHEHAVPEARRAAPDASRRPGREGFERATSELQSRGMSHGLERIEGVAEGPQQPEALPGAAGRCGDGAGAQRQAQEDRASRRHAVGDVARRGCSST